MSYSVYDLAFTYIERFCTEEPTTEEKREIISAFEDLLAYGWTTEEIVKQLKAFMVRYPNQKPDIAILFSKLHSSRANLIHPERFYYHNALRLMPGPPKRMIDYNSGEIKKVEEDYFLELKASFTIDDLVDYYLSQFRQDASYEERKRVIGSMKYLLKNHEIDLMLFMIDVASNNVFTEDMNRIGFNPLHLADWKQKAQDTMSQKITENKMTGDDRIVPRKRVLSFRSGRTV